MVKDGKDANPYYFWMMVVSLPTISLSDFYQKECYCNIQKIHVYIILEIKNDYKNYHSRKEKVLLVVVGTCL